MLILTRRIGESLIIETPAGERIEVAVLGVKGNQDWRASGFLETNIGVGAHRQLFLFPGKTVFRTPPLNC